MSSLEFSIFGSIVFYNRNGNLSVEVPNGTSPIPYQRLTDEKLTAIMEFVEKFGVPESEFDYSDERRPWLTFSTGGQSYCVGGDAQSALVAMF